MHIFIDPNPPKDDSAWKERKRLFETAGTSWLDYSSLVKMAGYMSEILNPLLWVKT